MRLLLPTYSFALAEVRSIELVRGVMGSRGLKFIVNSGVHHGTPRRCSVPWPTEMEDVIFWVPGRQHLRAIGALPEDLIQT
jgi:hypothetical protein